MDRPDYSPYDYRKKISAFRKEAKTLFPTAQFKVKTYHFHDLARGSRPCLSIIKADTYADFNRLNRLARAYRIIEDGRIVLTEEFAQ